MRRKIDRSVQRAAGAKIQSGFGWLNDHGNERPLVRRNHQAGLERIGRALPPIDQLACVEAETAAIGETSLSAADFKQAAVVSLIAVWINPGGHRDPIGIEEQRRERYPCGSRAKPDGTGGGPIGR